MKVWSRSCPGICIPLPERNTAYIEEEAGWAQKTVWMISYPARIRNPKYSSLYLSHYSAHALVRNIPRRIPSNTMSPELFTVESSKTVNVKPLEASIKQRVSPCANLHIRKTAIWN